MNTKKKQPSYSDEARGRAVRLVKEQQNTGLAVMGSHAVDIAEAGLYVRDAASLNSAGCSGLIGKQANG